jgi:lipopolysaccharide transport protein LptA
VSGHPSRAARAPALLALLLVAARDAAPLDVRADRFELDQSAGTARFEGNVVATQDDVELRCARLVARYERDGQVAEVVADGGVHVQSKALAATAAEARFDRAAGELVLTGQPEVHRGPDTLRGNTIRIWPDTGRVVVEQARGTLMVPRLSAVTPPSGGTR